MKSHRVGLALLLSSLLLIALVIGLLLQHQQAAQLRLLRLHGADLTHTLASLPLERLAPADARPGMLAQLFVDKERSDVAYAAITSPTGAVLAAQTRAGITPPRAPLPANRAASFGDRLVDHPGGRGQLLEFYGPVFDGPTLHGTLRVAMVAPGMWPGRDDVYFYAGIGLLMFLLMPLAYGLLRHNVEPLAARLNAVADSAAARIATLEHDSTAALAHARVLEYSNNKMTAVLQCLPDGVLLLDPSGEVTFANSKLEPLLGIALADVLSEPLGNWCRDPKLRALLARYETEPAEAGRQSALAFNPLAVPDKQLLALTQPLLGAQGAMAFGTLVVLRDTTREHLAQQAGNDFVAHVSHELKSPLNVIGMYTEMLQDAPEGDKALRVESLNVIQDEVERMNSLVNNLLNVSKLETGSMSPERNRVKLDDLLRDAHAHALPRAQARAITLDLHVARELSAVSIDKDLFRIALNNLLTNAVKYNRDGGHVWLSAEEGEHEIVISVRDTGLGIAPEAQAHVFEKFYRASDGEAVARGGHGLGLYLAAQIIELHHGRIALQSEPGVGSVFTIYLKKAAAPTGGSSVL